MDKINSNDDSYNDGENLIVRGWKLCFSNEIEQIVIIKL
jgi:hypothetical protein